MRMKLLLCCTLLLGWAVAAHAQTACPPGLIPYAAGAGGGVAACGPDPSSSQQQQQFSRPPLWADRWGAVASAPQGKPSFGAALDMPSERSAKKKALLACQASGSECKIAMTYHNQCIAIVAGEEGWTPAVGPTTDVALNISLERCKADGSSKCRTYYTACSYPVRIQ